MLGGVPVGGKSKHWQPERASVGGAAGSGARTFAGDAVHVAELVAAAAVALVGAVDVGALLAAGAAAALVHVWKTASGVPAQSPGHVPPGAVSTAPPGANQDGGADQGLTRG